MAWFIRYVPNRFTPPLGPRDNILFVTHCGVSSVLIVVRLGHCDMPFSNILCLLDDVMVNYESFDVLHVLVRTRVDLRLAHQNTLRDECHADALGRQ